MLSNITNYLFGGYQNNDEADKDVHFQEVEEDDWTVVDTLGNKHDNDEDLIISSETYIALSPPYMKSENSQNSRPPVPEKSTSRRRSISCKRLVNRRCSTPLRELSPACVNSKALVPYVPRKESRSSSKSSLYGMEESWYITPPPCFVSGPYETKPSSLENLLIEQPGVTYLVGNVLPEHLTNAGIEFPSSDKHKLPPKHLSKQIKQKENIKTITKEKETPQQEEKRRQILEIHEQKKFINSCQSQINTAQKVEQKTPGQFSKRNQMERLNKVQYELSSRKKRQRRADLNKKHSGVNNNRKCCY